MNNRDLQLIILYINNINSIWKCTFKLIGILKDVYTTNEEYHENAEPQNITNKKKESTTKQQQKFEKNRTTFMLSLSFTYKRAIIRRT